MSEATLPLLEPQPPTASHGVRRSSEGRAAKARPPWASKYFPGGPEKIKMRAANRKAIRKERRILMVHLYTM
jgi:hypothetical protein